MHFCEWGSTVLGIRFDGSVHPLRIGIFPGIRLFSHAYQDIVTFQHLDIRGTAILSAFVRMVDGLQPQVGLLGNCHPKRRHSVFAIILSANAHPTIFLEYMSVMRNKYIKPSFIRIYVISLTHTWLGRMGAISFRRFGYTGKICPENVVRG